MSRYIRYRAGASRAAASARSAADVPEPAGAMGAAGEACPVTTDGPARIVEVRASRQGGFAAGSELRVLVLEDGRRLRVDAERIARLGLDAGVTIPPRTVAVLEAEDAYLRAREAAVRLLAARPRSIAELRERLRRSGVPAEPAGAVVGDFAAAGYLDDLEFARAWIRSRLATRAYGLARVRSELREKGVARPLIEQAIRDMYGEEDVAVAEERLARGLAERRFRTYGRLAWDTRVRRLAGLLQRRGFSAHVIARVLRTVGRHDHGDTEDA